ncbi:hypothetical protein ACFL6S_19680 [Candidatus Poribacteria bacterium]
MTRRFPITKLSCSIPEKGVHVAKRGEGTEVARCSMDLHNFSLSELVGVESITQDQLEKAGKVKTWIEQGLKRVTADASRVTETSIGIEFLMNHDVLMDIEDGTSIRCDIDVADEIGQENGVSALYALGLIYGFSAICSDDEGDALNNVIAFYEDLPENHRNGVDEILSQPQLDTGNVFLRFLQNSFGKPQDEKDRLIAWVRGRSQVDLPYDDADVIKALEEETDLAALRLRVYNAINDTYVESVDTENANRIADMCSEKGMRIVAGRFSRALYLDVMLMANAKVIDASHLRESVSDLEKLVRSSTPEFADAHAGAPLQMDFSRIAGEMQMIANLAAEERVSYAQIEGVISKFSKALREFETYCLDRLDAGYSMLDNGFTERASMAARGRSEIRDKVEEILGGVTKVAASCLDAATKEPVFLIFLQRIHPLDAINMGTLNQLVDPFFGEDEEVHKLMRGCGHIMYTTANLKGWLRKCDDWIEALPAYAAYEIIPQETGAASYKVTTHVWRAILEEVYKQHAENWAMNIDEVMALEHIALAREILVQEHGLDDEAEVIKEIVSRELVQETAGLAALIESIYFDQCNQIARSVEEQGLSRMEVLRQLIGENELLPSLDNLPSAIEKSGLARRAGELQNLVTKPRREFPSVHVLTTLGPGETENIENWLEESMALFNVSRAHDLEDTSVQKRVSDYQKRICNLGERIVEELDLEGDLYNIMQTEGLPNREAGILRLIGSYPEVAAKVAELAVLIDYEEKQTDHLMDPENTSEPLVVTEYVNSHPELNEATADDDPISLARGKVVGSLGLGENVRNYLRDHQSERLGMVTARREVIAENGLVGELAKPRFRYESHGALKKYNLLYTPSRVDLGIDEVESVKNVPKWIGGRDRQAANAGKSLYGLYNLAGPTAMPATRFAEFLKVGENFFSRGGVFYLSLAAGANLDALGMGDFEFFRDQWNMRGDRTVLPAGETYGGFCVPKEFTLLYSIILAALEPGTSKEILDSFQVPEELRESLLDDLRAILQIRSQFDNMLDWEAKAFEMLDAKYSAHNIQFPRLATTLESKGIISGSEEEDVATGYRFANWVNKKAHGLEEINRSGPFRKVHLIQRLAKEARKRNPDVAPDNKLIGLMSAPYKEGGRKDGREVPVSDVRFSAGARKLEIYAGTALEHLLKHIDPEGGELIKGMFRSFQSPADMRIVGMCTASDLLNHVPGAGLEEIADTINEQLLEIGLSQDIIDANCQIYGGDLEKWVDVKEMPASQRQALVDEIGAHIHLLVLSRRGLFRTYEEAVQGVDFIDLGIPDPELLDLVDDMPKLLYLMRRGRPNSALVFADGTSGARRRTFSFRYSSSRRKAKELFALDENVVYGALGLGGETVASWRQEMMKERQYAQDLLDALVSGRHAEAASIYDNIAVYVRREGKAEEAAQEEIMARKFKVLSEDYRYISDALGKVKRGLPLGQLDFGTWVILGGMHVLNGKASSDEIDSIRSQFERAIEQLGGDVDADRMSALPGRVVERFVRPRYEPMAEVELYREIDTGISGSLKATEEKVGRLQKREARRREAVRAVARTRRREAFEKQLAEIGPAPVGLLYESAMEALGDARSEISQEDFGSFLAWAQAGILSVDGSIDPVFPGAEITDEAYMDIATDLAQSAIPADGDRESLEEIATAMELLDIALVVEKTIDVESPEEMTIAVARFFDTTVNNHIFDYTPYHYHKQRGDGFESLTREGKLELAERHHRWLYTYTRYLIAAETEMQDEGPGYADVWLGDADRDLMGLGVDVTVERERFWFSYARLRDAVVLKHDGFPFPKIFSDLDPDALKCNDRANVVIVYPHGNTTVPVALEQGAKLAREEEINLMLCAFPRIEHDDEYGRRVLRVPDGFMYIGAEDYKEALLSSGVELQEAEAKCREVDDQGILVAAKFREPIVAHGIFFHFTHPMRPDIESVRAPLIQPIIWEAATHLKCRLPEMLKGSGVRTADQINWFSHQTAEMSEDEARKQIRQALRQFAEKHTRIIAKPEKESGGRMAKILPVRQGGEYLEENIDELADVVYTISRVDNAAIQDVLPSHVRRLYSEEFLEDMVDRFARIGVPTLLDREPRTPLYSYFRQVVALGKRGYEITHHITVVSTRGIANVGQGGILYEYTDEIISPKYRADMRREITKAALDSMESQGKYIKEHWREMLEEYLQIHPEFANRIKIEEPGTDLTGFSDADIPYEMGDYMPVFLVDEADNLVSVFDRDSEELVPLFNKDGSPTDVQVFDENGKPVPRVNENGSPVSIPMFEEDGSRIPRFDSDGEPISTLMVFKIEPNPGAGLWRPHNDQLPEERKGEGVFKIFKCLGERAQVYRDRLDELAGKR